MRLVVESARRSDREILNEMPESFRQAEPLVLSYLEGYRDGELVRGVTVKPDEKGLGRRGMNVFGAYLAGYRAARNDGGGGTAG